MSAIIAVVAAVTGGLASFAFFGKRKIINFERKQEESREMVVSGKKEAEEITADTKKNTADLVERGEDERARIKRHIEKITAAAKRKEDYVKRNESRNAEVRAKITQIDKHTKDIHKKSLGLEIKAMHEMAAKAGTTPEKEHENILENLKAQQKIEIQERLNQIEDSLRENSEKKAREVLIDSMQRLSMATSVEKKGVELKVPKDHIKAKIVGVDAENISYIEEELNVNIVFNDLPNTISVSSYHLLNQHIAAKTIEILIKTPHAITKDTIKKALEQARKITESELEKIGKEVTEKLNFKNRSKKLHELIGRLKYRTSYGQNILKHSYEVAWVSVMMGSELGLDVEVCKVGGFLHDLGKAIDQDPDVQGSHDFLTKELMEELGFSEAEVHAAWTHHESEPPNTPEAKIVQAADAISAGRPGARQETIDKYVERLKALEEIASSFEGVKSSFAISAGREVRIMVDPLIVNDEAVKAMATKAAKTIEENLAYPGKIKVNVIRRVKSIEIAK